MQAIVLKVVQYVVLVHTVNHFIGGLVHDNFGVESMIQFGWGLTCRCQYGREQGDQLDGVQWCASSSSGCIDIGTK